MVIALKLRLSEVEKDKIYTSEKTGKKYLDLILMGGREVDKYGNDGFVCHDVTKEERAEGVKGTIVGNWKFLSKDNGQAAPKPKPEFKKPPPPAEDEDIPF